MGAESTQLPHLTPKDTWKTLFQPPPEDTTMTQASTSRELTAPSGLFRPSHVPAHKEILRVLGENAQDSITIVAIGPLTNLAMAAADDPETFLRVKEVVVMGGAIEGPGNVGQVFAGPVDL